MNAPQEIRLEALFLHDTQTAQLCRAQALLTRRAAALGLGERLPFRFAPPFCPLTPGTPLRGGRLRLKEPREKDGWILMEAELPALENADDSGPLSPEAGARPGPSGCPSLPGYPPLPGFPAFVLGYFGTRASELLAAPGLSEILPGEFSVRAWYRAELRVRISEPGSGCASAEWEIGPPRWYKAAQ